VFEGGVNMVLILMHACTHTHIHTHRIFRRRRLKRAMQEWKGSQLVFLSPSPGSTPLHYMHCTYLLSVRVCLKISDLHSV
jgi:hypothetical protein